MISQGNLSQRIQSIYPILTMEVFYTSGPRYVDGINIDADVAADFPKVLATQEISEPVTGIGGEGYEPGQKNRDGGDL